MNYNKKGRNQFMDLVTDAKVEKIVILYKDRLVQFGQELLETMCSKFGATIEMIDNTEKTEPQELVEDLVQILTVFSSRLRGKCANQAKKRIKERMEDDNVSSF